MNKFKNCPRNVVSVSAVVIVYVESEYTHSNVKSGYVSVGVYSGMLDRVSFLTTPLCTVETAMKTVDIGTN